MRFGVRPWVFSHRASLAEDVVLAGAVEADDEDARRLVEIQGLGIAAEQGDEFVVEDLDDLLAGRDAAQHVPRRAIFPSPGR